MKLLLTAESLKENNFSYLLDMVRLLVNTNNIGHLKWAFVPTAAYGYRMSWIRNGSIRVADKSKTILENNRIHPQEVRFEQSNATEALRRSDVVFVEGGNTFYLRKHMFDHQLDDVLNCRVRDGNALYIGVSAGSVVAGADIRVARLCGDPKVKGLPDTKGLGWLSYSILPHWPAFTSSLVNRFYDEVRTGGVKILPNGHAIVVDGKNEQYIEVPGVR